MRKVTRSLIVSALFVLLIPLLFLLFSPIDTPYSWKIVFDGFNTHIQTLYGDTAIDIDSMKIRTVNAVKIDINFENPVRAHPFSKGAFFKVNHPSVHIIGRVRGKQNDKAIAHILWLMLEVSEEKYNFYICSESMKYFKIQNPKEIMDSYPKEMKEIVEYYSEIEKFREK